MARGSSALASSAIRALQELAVAVEVEGSYLRCRLADQVAVADEDLVILCGFASYADAPADWQIPPRDVRVCSG
jgi:hypothetical protein